MHGSGVEKIRGPVGRIDWGDGQKKLRDQGLTSPGPHGGFNQPIYSGRGTIPSNL